MAIATCRCCSCLTKVRPFDEARQRRYGLVEELEIPNVQRTLPGMLADGHALAALRSLYSGFLVSYRKGTCRPFWAILGLSQTIPGPGLWLAAGRNRGTGSKYG